jgi:hypothetical protein
MEFFIKNGKLRTRDQAFRLGSDLLERAYGEVNRILVIAGGARVCDGYNDRLRKQGLSSDIE